MGDFGNDWRPFGKPEPAPWFTKKGDKTPVFIHQIIPETYYEIEILLTLGECILWAKSAWLQDLLTVRTSAN